MGKIKDAGGKKYAGSRNITEEYNNKVENCWQIQIVTEFFSSRYVEAGARAHAVGC